MAGEFQLEDKNVLSGGAGASVYLLVSLNRTLYKISVANLLSSLITGITSIFGKTLPGSNIVGISDYQTLTNKTISALNNTISNIGYSNLASSIELVNSSNKFKVSGSALTIRSFVSDYLSTIAETMEQSGIDSQIINSLYEVGLLYSTEPTQVTGLSATYSAANPIMRIAWTGQVLGMQHTIYIVIDDVSNTTVTDNSADAQIISESSTNVYYVPVNPDYDGKYMHIAVVRHNILLNHRATISATIHKLIDIDYNITTESIAASLSEMPEFSSAIGGTIMSNSVFLKQVTANMQSTRDYAGDPTNHLTPYKKGEIVISTTDGDIYMANGTTSANWKLISTN